MGHVECEYDLLMRSYGDRGYINGRPAQRLDDGWIVVKDTIIKECHASHNKAPLGDGRVESLQAEVTHGYLDDISPPSNMDGFIMWRDNPKNDYNNGWAVYFDCSGEGWTKVLDNMFPMPGMDLYLYKKDSKPCFPGHGGVCTGFTG